MFDKLIDYLKRKEWNYIEGKYGGVVSFNLSGKNGIFHCYAHIEEERKRFLFFTYCTAICPSDIIIRMAELLMRLNSNVFFGNFELNFETGEIKFKTSIFFEDIELTDTAIDNIIINNVFIVDDCTPAIFKLIYSNISPLEAYNGRTPQQITNG